MTFILTARHFKAHPTLKEFAESEIQKITKFYDGIIKTEVILSYDKPSNSVKTAEIVVHANNHHTFTARETTDEFEASIELAINKVITQIKKYKDKISDHSPKKLFKLMNQNGESTESEEPAQNIELNK
jgi:putative sigma-54 modulation protein